MVNQMLRVGQDNDFFKGVADLEAKTGSTVVYGSPPKRRDPDPLAVAAE